MSVLVVRGRSSVRGSARVPGDKSISHRALMMGAVAKGESTVNGLGLGADVGSTIRCLRSYGVRVVAEGDRAVIESSGVLGWRPPTSDVDCGNSGTTMRLLAGLAARCPFESTLDGDESLRRRPMERVAGPLRLMGAQVSVNKGGRPPMVIMGGRLRGVKVDTGVASAQVKSAVLLAALGAEGITEVVEPLPTRDHTERMLESLGAPIEWGPGYATVGPWEPGPFELRVAPDVSSAYFLLAAAAVAGDVEVPEVGLNPARLGFLEVLERMGASVECTSLQESGSWMAEPVGRIRVKEDPLFGVDIGPMLVPRLHDELPLFAVLASQAEGKSVVSGAEELRLKESDRISAVCTELSKMGADIDELPDGFAVRGPVRLEGSDVDSHGDHRMAMALVVAGLAAEGETRVHGFECAGVSWPDFTQVLAGLGAEVETR